MPMNVKIMLPNSVHAEVKESATKEGISLAEVCRRTMTEFGTVNLAVREELQKAAEMRNTSVSGLLNSLIPKLSLTDTSIKTIMLKIPIDVMKDQKKLEEWVLQKCSILISKT